MRRGGALLVAALLVAACSGGGEDDAAPSPTTRPMTPTSLVDRSGIGLAGVPGVTTTTVAQVGRARIVGTVEGPAGPVAGATVRIERLVAGQDLRTDLLTDEAGAFLLDGIPGGRYRVRAFLAPGLAQLEPDVRFLEDGREHEFRLVVVDPSGVVIRADVAPEPPLLGRAVNLVALVVTRSVSPDGVVRSVPLVGTSVELVGLGRWVLRDDRPRVEDPVTTDPFDPPAPPRNAARTDGNGLVRFELQCNVPGPSGLQLRLPVRVVPAPGPLGPDQDRATTTTVEPQVQLRTFDLDIPSCVDPATTTTIPPSTTPTTA